VGGIVIYGGIHLIKMPLEEG